MKKRYFFLVVGLLAALAACNKTGISQVRTVTPGNSEQNSTGHRPNDNASVTEAVRTLVPSTSSSVTMTAAINEETKIRNIVEGFGKQLQLVSLQSPTASQDIEERYSEFVSPELMRTWISDVSIAPGRIVSSPWPDRIEIVQLAQQAPDQYAVTGYIVQVTSKEVAGGGEAARIPVRMTVQKTQGRWTITEYSEER